MRNPLQHVPRLGILALPLHCKRGSGRTTARAPIWPGGLSLCSARETVFSASSFAPDFKLRHHPRPKPLDTACIIKEEPNSARSEEHTSELQSLRHLVCRLLLE